MSWTPLAPASLPGRVAEWLAAADGVVRVAIDGAPAADPDALADALVPELERRGRPAAVVGAATFWRDASLRFEHGREDLESYLTGWLDADALRREVLVPAVDRGEYLPSLRDPGTNRSTREPLRPLPHDGILLVTGALLLGHGLPFDRTVHLTLSPGALARRTPPGESWTLPAYEQYDAQLRPAEIAGFVVKLDDPRHPAIRVR